MHLKLILFTILIAYFVAGWAWFRQDNMGRQAVQDTCEGKRTAVVIASFLIVASWPYWFYKYLSLARLYMRTMRTAIRERSH